MKLDDRRLAVELQNLIDRRIDRAVRERLTGHRYGLVSGSPDTVARTVAVRLYGLPQPSPGFHYGTGLAPRDGDHVRVYIDPRGDKWIDDILGRDLVSEIVDVVTPPVVQPDRARGAVVRVLTSGGSVPPFPDEIKADYGIITLDNLPSDGKLIIASVARRGTGASFALMPGSWTTIHDVLSLDGHSMIVGWRRAAAETVVTYGGVSATQVVVAVYPASASIGATAVRDPVVAGTVVDCGGPVAADPLSEVWGFAINTFFFGATVTPDGAGETTVWNHVDPTGNPPGFWVAHRPGAVPTGTLPAPANWSGVTVEVKGVTLNDPLVPGPEAVDGDDSTYLANDGGLA